MICRVEKETGELFTPCLKQFDKKPLLRWTCIPLILSSHDFIKMCEIVSAAQKRRTFVTNLSDIWPKETDLFSKTE